MGLAFDAADGYLVGWGGWVDGGPCPAAYPACNVTWVFQSGAWRELNTPTTPPLDAGGRSSIAYDAADGYILLYEGEVHIAYTIYSAETWKLQAGNWTRLYEGDLPNQPYAKPSGNDWMTYDGADHEVVLYGDWSNNSTWTFASGAWSLVNTTAAPSTLGFAAMTFDASQGYVLLYGAPGNLTGNFSVQTWIFRAGNWSAIPTPGFAGGLAGGLAYDPNANGSLALAVNGTTWLWGVAPLSYVAIYANPTPTDLGVPVAFTADLAGGTTPYTYAWNFGDGGTNTSGAPQHSYQSLGSFHVTLQITDGLGASRNGTTTVVVDPTPNGSFFATPNPTDVGLGTQFRQVETGGVAPYVFRWLFGDGNSSPLQDPVHNYSTPGTYLVRGWTNDSVGQSVPGNLSIVVRGPLRVTTLTATPDPVDLAAPVNFTATAGGGTSPYTFSWAFGDGGTGGNLSTITHLFTTNGPFVSTVRVVDSLGESATATINLTIRLNASIFANVSSGLAPLPVQFHAEATGGLPGYSYSWTFGDGTSGGVAVTSHVYSSPGRYLVNLQVRDASGHVANASTNVTVEAAVRPGSSSVFAGGWSPPWEIALIAAALVLGAAIGIASRRSPPSPLGLPPKGAGSPYAPYSEAVRSTRGESRRLPAALAARESPPSGEESSDHLSDLF
ncbi:MAG: PKD domain-containing protein [Thermoplasmata archaeon]|nr:PKD domain-containing protein [Thermoplasmata archaeon]